MNTTDTIKTLEEAMDYLSLVGYQIGIHPPGTGFHPHGWNGSVDVRNSRGWLLIVHPTDMTKDSYLDSLVMHAVMDSDSLAGLNIGEHIIRAAKLLQQHPKSRDPSHA